MLGAESFAENPHSRARSKESRGRPFASLQGGTKISVEFGIRTFTRRIEDDAAASPSVRERVGAGIFASRENDTKKIGTE